MTVDGDVWIRQLQLEHIRVYRDVVVDIAREGLRLVGSNGTGKSTFIEAIELLSPTRPRRGALDADLIAHDSGVELGVAPYGRVVGEAIRGDVHARIEVFLQKGERRNSTRKLLRVGDRPRRASDVVGIIPTVSFAPDDLDLILGSPSVRRRFLDILLSQTDRRYLRLLSRYAKVVSQRNGLLKRFHDEPAARIPQDEFAFWDEQLVALGSYILTARVRAVRQLNDSARDAFATLSPQTGELTVQYLPTVQGSDAWWDEVVTAEDPVQAAQRVGVAFEQQVKRSLQQDIARGATNLGTHRDDLGVLLNGRPLERFGSRGQQRLAVIAMKLAEIDLVSSVLGLRPVLLLDDVMSELDERHRRLLISMLQEHQGQLIITATDRSLVEMPDLAKLPLAQLTEPGVLAFT